MAFNLDGSPFKIGVFTTPLAGRLVDRVGRLAVTIPAAFVIGSAMVGTALTDDLYNVLGLVGVWTVAGSILNVAPTTAVSDETSTNDRPQALAMLRTAGDVGMLAGSILAGFVADATANLAAVQVNGSLMMGVAAFAGLRFLQAVRSGNTPR